MCLDRWGSSEWCRRRGRGRVGGSSAPAPALPMENVIHLDAIRSGSGPQGCRHSIPGAFSLGHLQKGEVFKRCDGTGCNKCRRRGRATGAPCRLAPERSLEEDIVTPSASKRGRRRGDGGQANGEEAGWLATREASGMTAPRSRCGRGLTDVPGRGRRRRDGCCSGATRRAPGESGLAPPAVGLLRRRRGSWSVPGALAAIVALELGTELQTVARPPHL